MQPVTPRWIQRFENFKTAYRRLEEVIDKLDAMYPVDEITLRIFEDSILQRFEFTQELAWKVIKDYLYYQGDDSIIGSRSAFRKALQLGIIADPMWMQTIEDRNLTSHKYDEGVASGVSKRVRECYMGLFRDFAAEMTGRQIADLQ